MINKVTIAAIGILVIALGLSGLGLKHYIFTTGKLQAELDDADTKLQGWQVAYGNMKAEYERSQQTAAEVRKQKQVYHQMVGRLEEELRNASQGNKCATERVPDAYIDALINGLPHNKAKPTGAMPGNRPIPSGADPVP